ncbi:hypothetical protein DFH08DRAFT_804647 [Mycena albidolilacea]|uniref:Uncharacterized protein n=1 Tax=Mycena albidolilacea TaxID=1033008 RepID=A0AAD7EUM7_9AGAR|nr:hypothetical protein DFH08DRAFT_804647 [Mycena albidolilacea]
MEREDGKEEEAVMDIVILDSTISEREMERRARIRSEDRTPSPPRSRRLPPPSNRGQARQEAPSSPRRLSISPPLVAGLGHGGDSGVRPGEREAGKKNGVVGLERRKKERSREEGMGSSVCILSSAADLAAIRSVESEGPSASGGRAFLSPVHKSHELTQTGKKREEVVKGEGKWKAVPVCVRPMRHSPLAQRHDHRQLKHAHSAPVPSAFLEHCFLALETGFLAPSTPRRRLRYFAFLWDASGHLLSATTNDHQPAQPALTIRFSDLHTGSCLLRGRNADCAEVEAVTRVLSLFSTPTSDERRSPHKFISTLLRHGYLGSFRLSICFHLFTTRHLTAFTVEAIASHAHGADSSQKFVH